MNRTIGRRLLAAAPDPGTPPAAGCTARIGPTGRRR
jgi:hypothetical protein